MTKKLELVFTVDRSLLLNSNNLAGIHRFSKSKMSAGLRSKGYSIALEHLSEEQRELAEARKKILDKESSNKVDKGKFTKKVKRAHPEWTKKEQDAEVERMMLEKHGAQSVKSSDMPIEPLFDKFTISVFVYPPTARRVDPANLYPTIKNVIDGLTDAGFWVDDDWTHLEELSFRYGGVNDTKKDFEFRLVIESIGVDDE